MLNCLHCDREITDRDAYTARHVKSLNQTYYMHYRCSVKNEKIPLFLSKNTISFISQKIKKFASSYPKEVTEFLAQGQLYE